MRRIISEYCFKFGARTHFGMRRSGSAGSEERMREKKRNENKTHSRISNPNPKKMKSNIIIKGNPFASHTRSPVFSHKMYACIRITTHTFSTSLATNPSRYTTTCKWTSICFARDRAGAKQTMAEESVCVCVEKKSERLNVYGGKKASAKNGTNYEIDSFGA